MVAADLGGSDEETGRLHKVAIFIEGNSSQRTLLYIGDAITAEGHAWLILENTGQRLGDAHRLLLDERCLVRAPPADPDIQADWSFVVQMPTRAFN